MKETINLYAFREGFRQVRPDNFSYEGLEVLFNHLEEFEEMTGEQMEFDVIAICCEYAEEELSVVIEQYDNLEFNPEAADPIEDLCEQMREWCGFAEYTAENTIVYRQY